MRPRSLASGSTTTRRALTTATPPAPKSHALAAVGAAAGALGSVAVGGLRRDSTHDSAGRRAPRGQRDLSPRRHVHGRCRRRCLLRGPRRRRRECGRRHDRSRSGRRRRRRRRLRGVGAVARRRPGRGLGPVGRRHASEARSTCSLSTTARPLPHQYAIAATRTPSARQSYSHRGPRRAAARGRAVRRHAGAEGAPWRCCVVESLWPLRKR